jgi:hypothetical protein
MLKQSTKPSQV